MRLPADPLNVRILATSPTRDDWRLLGGGSLSLCPAPRRVIEKYLVVAALVYAVNLNTLAQFVADRSTHVIFKLDR